MGINTSCCVKRELEEERNLQKIRPKLEYGRNDNRIENGGYFTVKTTDKISNDLNTNFHNNNTFFIKEENIMNEESVKKIQKQYRLYKNKTTYKKK